MRTIQQDQLATGATEEAGYFEPVVLHYVKKATLTESAVLGTEVLALCGERWTADENDYEITAAGQGDRKSVVCPLCGDVLSELHRI